MFDVLWVLAGPSQLPRFWIFMYRCNPFTYPFKAILSTGLANTRVVCSEHEYVVIEPPAGQTCQEYMLVFITMHGGYLLQSNNGAAESGTCSYCTMDETNTFLKSVNALFSQRWRNYGIFNAFIVINVALFFLLVS